MLIQITGSTFWLLVSFFFVVFDFFCLSGFCFIRNHASSLVVDIFFPTISLKKKKVIKTTRKSVSFFFWCVLIVAIATVVVFELVSLHFHPFAF